MPHRSQLVLPRLVALIVASQLSTAGALLAQPERQGEQRMPAATQPAPPIPGYTYGTPAVPRSPLTLADLA